MEYLIVFNKSIVPIVTILAIAFAYNKFFKPNISEISSLALNVFAPVMIFYSVLNNKITTEQLIKPSIFMLALTISLITISYTASVMLRLKGDSKLSLILSSSMINVGNFGLPLIYFAYGDKAIPYSMIYFVIFNIPLITIAIYLTSKKKSITGPIRDILKMPIFYAFILALIFSELSITLPNSLLKGFELMNSAAIALLVFILGLQLASIKIKIHFAQIIFVAIFIRLIISPILSYSITWILQIDSLERAVSIVQTSTPSALLPLMYMLKFKRNSDLLAAIILSTVVISGFTLPFIIKFL
jgi:predicted permease